MKIILMRHGQPSLDVGHPLVPIKIQRWIEVYERAVVKQDCAVPSSSQALATRADFIVTSRSPRAISSVRLLGYEPSLVDDAFREVSLPSIPRLPPLPPFLWAIFFRLLWCFGYSHRLASLRCTRVRARTAARRLIRLAKKGPILLVGHGIMNRLIARELVSLGWFTGEKETNRYWSAEVLTSTPVYRHSDLVGAGEFVAD